MIGLIALLAAAVPGCVPVVGADKLWLPQTRWVIVGEIHGTQETPDAFANLVCLASASGRRVTVALEYSADWQPAIDAYINSDGGTKAREALLTLPVWHAALPDGRGSVAFLRMLDRLRAMKREGRIVGVIGADVGRSQPSDQTRDAGMAQAWRAIPAPGDGLILSLVGNIHAMYRPMVRPDRTIVTAGSFMPAAQTVTVNVRGNGGKAWNCQADGCREHDNGVPRAAAAGISFATDPDYPWRATYELGRQTTAAAPAIAVTSSP